MNRNGITAAGNWIVDRVKQVDCLPRRGMLANIKSMCFSPGGAPANVLNDLARLRAFLDRMPERAAEIPAVRERHHEADDVGAAAPHHPLLVAGAVVERFRRREDAVLGRRSDPAGLGLAGEHHAGGGDADFRVLGDVA